MTLPQFLQNLRQTVAPFTQRLGKIIRPIAYPIIKGLFGYGQSLSQTQQVLKDIGLIQPGTTFEKQTAADYEMLYHEPELRRLPKNEVPSFDLLTEKDFGRAEHFRWIIEIIGVDRFTGYPAKQVISLYSNELMPAKQLLKGVNFSEFTGKSGGIIQLLNFEIMAIQHNPGAPYGAL